MNFIETRGNDDKKPKEVAFSEAILNPSASFGGLFCPKNLPTLSLEDIQKLSEKNYKELSWFVLKNIFEIDIVNEEIQKALDLYDYFDDPLNPAPLIKLNDTLFVNELYHGPTRAFKDMALQPFGSLLSTLAKKSKENYLILAATSGDTGPAALNTFKNKDNIKVVCIYPDGGTSDVQRLQMVTENGKNLKVIGIKGNFDDAQSALKNLLSSQSFAKKLSQNGLKLSAANSVNFGRIIFQIVYHMHSYLQLLRNNEVKLGEKIYLIVPSGNFGNALGGYYAKKMGFPIEKILIASNQNNILTEWITTGIYDISNKSLKLTKSPAMDILKSSNIERVLFDKFGPIRTKEMMDDLNTKNKFELTKDELSSLQEDFDACFSDDDYGKKVIQQYLTKNYLMDPHTATCLKAYENLNQQNLKCVMYSTAEWTKFSPTVCNALNNDDKKYSDKEALDEISTKFGSKICDCVSKLFSAQILHSDVVDKNEIEGVITDFIEK
jgi:threonine synthase